MESCVSGYVGVFKYVHISRFNNERQFYGAHTAIERYLDLVQ
jgi:hypothetical protein